MMEDSSKLRLALLSTLICSSTKKVHPMSRLLICLVACLFAVNPAPSWGQKKKTEKELTLKEIFPEKSFFGPRARGAAFSADGRFGAYLYHDYNSRRHGNDLWIYDFKTGKKSQITSVVVMSEFQKSARKIKKLRLDAAKKAADKKAKEAAKGKKGAGKKNASKKAKSKKATGKTSQKDIDKTNKIINIAGEKDADNEKGPRYSGITSFEWHPKSN